MTGAGSQDPYSELIPDRLAALERVFGKHDEYLISPLPFYLGGDPTIVGFANYLKGATVYVTSEMTGGWASRQTVGEHGEYELIMVVPKRSSLAPYPKENADGKPMAMAKGWVGVMLSTLAKRTLEAVFAHGHTAGPIHPELAPMTRILFVDVTNDHAPFEFSGRRYGLLLCMLINDAELAFLQSRRVDELIKRLKAANIFPVSMIRENIC